MKKDGTWYYSKYKNYKSIVGENNRIRVELVPERGSKLVSLVDKDTKREWIFSNNSSWEKPLKYGMQFKDGDHEGWDEMFPAVVTSPYPERPWNNVVIPDHGEVWTLFWENKLMDKVAKLIVYGVQIPYILQKEYELIKQDLKISYTLYNNSPFRFCFLWVAHPLLKIEEGMKIETDKSLNSAIIYLSEGQRLGSFNDKISYPVVKNKNGTFDLSMIDEPERKYADKYWLEGIYKSGQARIFHPKTNESLVFNFDPKEIPFLGIWINYGGYCNEYNIALEPAIGFLDDLYVAYNMNKFGIVNAYSIKKWSLSVSVNN